MQKPLMISFLFKGILEGNLSGVRRIENKILEQIQDEKMKKSQIEEYLTSPKLEEVKKKVSKIQYLHGLLAAQVTRVFVTFRPWNGD